MRIKSISLLLAFFIAVSALPAHTATTLGGRESSPPPVTPTVTTLLSANPSVSATFTPAAGMFALVIDMTGSPTCQLQRQADPSTTRTGNITGTTNVALTAGTTAYLQTGMMVSGTGIAEGTTITLGGDNTHFTLSQAATNGTDINLKFWRTQETYTVTQPGLTVNWPTSRPWRVYMSGTGTAMVNWMQ